MPNVAVSAKRSTDCSTYMGAASVGGVRFNLDGDLRTEVDLGFPVFIAPSVSL